MKLLTVSKFIFVSLATFGLVFASSGSALAHVTVKPGEALTASYQTFTVNVPNEKDMATVRVKLVIPAAIASVTPTQKAGWKIVQQTSGSGQDRTVEAITWQGGQILEGTRDEFSFSAKLPDSASDLQWKAYQTYADGTVVAWDKASEAGSGHDDQAKNSGPFSVTKVVKQTTQDKSASQLAAATAAAETNSERALYASTTAVVLAVAGIFLATRKKQ